MNNWREIFVIALVGTYLVVIATAATIFVTRNW